MYSIEELRKVEKEISLLQQKRGDMLNAIMKSHEKLSPKDVALMTPDFLSDFRAVEKLDINKNTMVCYQGVPGAYSHQAMFDFFGKEIQNKNVLRFEDVIETVKKGEADYGVLPVENSSAGFVNGIYDMLGSSGITVVGENEIPVAHALMGVRGAKLSDIKTVYSHTQGLLQCKEYLDKSGYKQESVANTALAAIKVKDENDKTQAAIASPLAAQLYDLDILSSHIVDNKNNTTRFIFLSREKIFDKQAEKLSICFSLPHESGTLYNILSHINLNGINMTRIESRPLSGKKWEYRFYVSMEGSLLDPATINALMGIYNDSIDFKLIGTY